MDTPGICDLTAADSTPNKSWLYLNFTEFVRVDFKGVAPVGNQVSGSRSSDYVPWHSRVAIEWDSQLGWKRMNSGGDNSIGQPMRLP